MVSFLIAAGRGGVNEMGSVRFAGGGLPLQRPLHDGDGIAAAIVLQARGQKLVFQPEGPALRVALDAAQAHAQEALGLQEGQQLRYQGGACPPPLLVLAQDEPADNGLIGGRVGGNEIQGRGEPPLLEIAQEILVLRRCPGRQLG